MLKKNYKNNYFSRNNSISDFLLKHFSYFNFQSFLKLCKMCAVKVNPEHLTANPALNYI